MKISGRKGNGSAGNVTYKKTAGVAPVASAGASGEGGSVGGAGGSSVAISDLGRQVAEARKQMEGIPEVRVEKVGRIQSALEAGTYQVDGGVVADKIVSDAVKEVRNRPRK